MKFEKIIIPPGWQESFTKYPNGKSIFEALSHTITTVNEGIEEANQKVDQGLLSIDQAENTIRSEITESFNTFKGQLEADIIEDFDILQSEVLTLISGKANAADVYTKQQVDAQLAEKVQNFKLKNEVVNGDFSNGTTGWNPNNATLSINGNELIGTSTSNINSSYIGFSTNIPGNAGDKIFTSVELKFKSDSEIIRFGFSDGYQTLNNVFSGNYKRISSISTKLSSNTFVMLQRIGTSYAIGDTFGLKKPTSINLTQIFGAGNEPTKLEMDELMKVIPNGWWGGELTLTQKQFITWQLNLIRKNTNAIIALGGTII